MPSVGCIKCLTISVLNVSNASLSYLAVTIAERSRFAVKPLRLVLGKTDVFVSNFKKCPKIGIITVKTAQNSQKNLKIFLKKGSMPPKIKKSRKQLNDCFLLFRLWFLILIMFCFTFVRLQIFKLKSRLLFRKVFGINSRE